jgi:hypothetical protein
MFDDESDGSGLSLNGHEVVGMAGNVFPETLQGRYRITWAFCPDTADWADQV